MNEIASSSTSTPPAAQPAPSKRQLLDTPINRAFLFLYNGAVRDKIKIPPILDTSDDEAENYPMISGVEYMRNAMDAQIKHEQAPDPSRAALVAALEEARKNEAVCHCGERWSAHQVYSSCTTFVEMKETCPYSEELHDARKEVETLRVLAEERRKEIAAHGSHGWIEIQKTCGRQAERIKELEGKIEEAVEGLINGAAGYESTTECNKALKLLTDATR